MSDNKDNKIVFRNAEIVRDEVKENERELTLAFSSEEPVLRFDTRNGEYWEVLGHTDGEMDNSFIGSGRAPLLLDHDQTKQIGVVTSVRVSDGRARALVKVSRSSAATEVLQDIVDGIRGNVSVGYYVNEQREDGKRSGKKVMRAVKWRPIEVSLVSIPADESVGVGRNKEAIANNNIKGVITMTEERKEQNVEKVDVEAIKREAALSEQARVRDIATLGNKFGMTKEAEQFIKNNKPVDDFRAFVLENVNTASKETEVKENREDANIGLSEKEIRQYSFLRAIRTQLDPNNAKFKKEAAFELECHRAAQELRGEDARGIIVPHDVLTRDLSAGGTNAGSELIATDVLAGSFIDVLRNKMVTAELGARMLTGLRGNVAIPRKTAASTAYWIATEGNSPTESQPALDQVSLTPKTVGAYTDYTRQLLLQSSLGVEAMVRDDLAETLAVAIDKAALYGGGSGEPDGIANTAGINAAGDGLTAFATPTPTFAELVAMESAVATNNALFGNLAYVVSPSMRGALKTQIDDTGSGIYTWSRDNNVNGYKGVATSQVTAGDVFFGNFAELMIGMWGGLDVTVDPYALSTSGGVRIVALQSVDCGVRHPRGFSFNNDGV